MFPASGGRIAGAILAAVLVIGVAASALAEPTTVTEIKGKKLYLFSEAGKRVGWVNSADVDVTPPLEIIDVSAKGKFLVNIPGKGEVWILKAQTVTNAPPPEVVVSCDNITETYAATRGFGDCN